MSSMLPRLAFVTVLALTVAPAEAGSALTHTQFVEGYVRCNNAAWTGVSRELIFHGNTPSMSDRMRGLDSPLVRGFVGEFLYFDGVYGNFEPRRAATVGWALATKAFADRGEVEPRFRTRGPAVALLRAHALRGVDPLSDREAGAIATELDLGGGPGSRTQITPIAAGLQLADPLTAGVARAMLAKVGTHFDVGSARTIAQPGRACPAKVLGGLFHGAT
jgi:hypothetical protein